MSVSPSKVYTTTFGDAQPVQNNIRAQSNMLLSVRQHGFGEVTSLRTLLWLGDSLFVLCEINVLAEKRARVIPRFGRKPCGAKRRFWQVAAL